MLVLLFSSISFSWEVYTYLFLYLGEERRKKKKKGGKKEKESKESLGTCCQEAENLKGYINQGKSMLSTLQNFHTERKNVKRMAKKHSSQEYWSLLKHIFKNKKNLQGIIFTDKPFFSCHIHSKNKIVPRRVTWWSAVKMKFNLAVTIDKVCQCKHSIKTTKNSLNEMLLT